MNRFIGSFQLEELPENANPGDIAQLRLNKDQVYRDSFGNSNTYGRIGNNRININSHTDSFGNTDYNFR